MTESANNEDKATILIVDDVPKNIQVLGHVLDKHGYLIAAATDGRQALAIVADVNPDLILMDIMMPIMDGFEACRRLKADPATRPIPIILLTAKTATEDIVQGFALGAVDYITKPFSAQELIARVQTHVELKRARDIQQALIEKLKEALKQVKQLSGLLPICSHCKKIRDDQGYWQQVEEYIRRHSEVRFSHGICPECVERYYPEFAAAKKTRSPG
jgi:CheY-like chemotaxis protein